LLRNSRALGPKALFAIAALIVCAALLGGCGKGGAGASAYTPTPTSATPKMPAAGTAVSSPLTFDQVALESPVKRAANKNGLIFLQFSYADRDGKIYKCELPDAMSKGSFPYDEWIRTFNIYRLPKVIGQKKVTKKGPAVIGDLPLISPRPQAVATPNQPQSSRFSDVKVPEIMAPPSSGGSSVPSVSPGPLVPRGPRPTGPNDLGRQ